MNPKDGTISDAEWRSLQVRALKANPELGRFGSPESVKGAKRGAENYRNREKN